METPIYRDFEKLGKDKAALQLPLVGTSQQRWRPSSPPWNPPCEQNERIMRTWQLPLLDSLHVMAPPLVASMLGAMCTIFHKNFYFLLVWLRFFKKGSCRPKYLKIGQKANITQENDNKNLISMCNPSQIRSVLVPKPVNFFQN